VNYDQLLRPTLLLHLGAGYLHTYNPAYPSNSFNQSSVGLNGYYSNLFPSLLGLSNASTGGVTFGFNGVGATNAYRQWDEKPTGNANLTWVKNNHTYKFGAEFVADGVIIDNLSRANGIFTFSPNETSDPWQGTASPALNSTSGFAYASFLLGAADSLTIAPPAQMKLGNHGIGLFAQDSWKVTRKLTLDYGLRYDFQTYLREQYGRMQDAAFGLMNTKIGRMGAVQYEGMAPAAVIATFLTTIPTPSVHVWESLTKSIPGRSCAPALGPPTELRRTTHSSRRTRKTSTHSMLPATASACFRMVWREGILMRPEILMEIR
jgi:hypothetical protein